jgi:hypothetical protein
MIKSPLFWLILTVLAISTLTAIGPTEKTLGSNARVVYLHGVWVWAALVAFLAAAVVGLVGLVTSRDKLHRWSRSLGRAGLIFWITYLPISMWAMQTNWNGLFLAEPRWRFALVFAVGGTIMQVGLVLVEDPRWASVANILYILVLILTLQNIENVMHPTSPIFNSDATRIQLYFIGLLSLTLLLVWQIASWMHRFERATIET